MITAQLLLVLLAAPASEDAPAEDLPTAQTEAKAGSIEDLYYKGAAQYSAADYANAIESFTAALEVAGREGTEPEIRGALLFNLARSHARAYDVDDEVSHLRRAMDIYRRFLEEVELHGIEAPDQISAAREDQENIRATLDKLEDEKQSGPEPAGPVAAEPHDQVDGKRRTRGLALTVTGGVLLAGGAGVAIYGTSFRRDAQAAVDAVEDPGEKEDQFLEDETRKGRIWVGAGVGIAVVGAGLLAWGIVDLLAAKKAKNVAAAPLIGPDMAGLALGGRF